MPKAEFHSIPLPSATNIGLNLSIKEVTVPKAKRFVQLQLHTTLVLPNQKRHKITW